MWIEQLLKHEAVRNGGLGDDDLSNQFVALVDAGVKFLAKVVLGMLLRPFRIDVFLRAFISFPGNEHPAFLDRLRLFAFIVLDQCLEKRCIDDLVAAPSSRTPATVAAPGRAAWCQGPPEQAVVEQPNRLSIGDCAAFIETEKLQGSRGDPEVDTQARRPPDCGVARRPIF
jgi:hypothetical protein